MAQAKNISDGTVPAYAIAGDFCRIFAQDMSGLYLLSFLLTADHQKAEQCFVSGLEDCVEANRVFKDWARSWTRRAIIQNAIRLMQPTRDYTGQLPDRLPADGNVGASDRDTPLAAVLGLRAFERFVFVMSVLERYSDQDCRALLGCSRRDVLRARARALIHLATFERNVPVPALDAVRRFTLEGSLVKTA